MKRPFKRASLSPQSQALTANSASPFALTASTAATVAPQNFNRNGIMFVADSGNTAITYLKLNGTASATSWDIQLPANGSWDGTISNVVWLGPVSAFSTATAKLSVDEV